MLYGTTTVCPRAVPSLKEDLDYTGELSGSKGGPFDSFDSSCSISE